MSKGNGSKELNRNSKLLTEGDNRAPNRAMLRAVATDHLIRQIDEQSGTAHYWPRRAIVEQGSVTGVFPSVLDGRRQKRSNLLNQLRYRWSKFRRHRLRGLLAILRSGWVKRS